MHTPHVTYIDHDVVNERLEPIGTVTDVVFEDGADHPKWLVVKPGMLRAERWVPVERSYESAQGHIVVPFEKKWVTSAPRARDHVMTADVEREATHHYGDPD